LLAAPAGWGRSTVLDQLPQLTGSTGAPARLVVPFSGRVLRRGFQAPRTPPDGPGPQGPALRDGLLAAEVRRQAAALLCRSQLRGAARLGAGSLLMSGMGGTISLLLAHPDTATRG